MERIARREEHRTSGASDEAARPNQNEAGKISAQIFFIYFLGARVIK
jgi:hypothetical protein